MLCLKRERLSKKNTLTQLEVTVEPSRIKLGQMERGSREGDFLKKGKRKEKKEREKRKKKMDDSGRT